MLLFLATKNFRSYLWGEVISELFTIAHPNGEFRYLLIDNKKVKLIKLLTALKWSILLVGCSEVSIFIIWNSYLYCVSRSRFSCKWSLIILILIIYLKRKKVTITCISDCFGLFIKMISVSALFMLLLTSNNNS